MDDIVLDTNVLMHASDPRERLCPLARALVRSIKDSETKICVDEGFNLNPAQNRSLIGQEYSTHLKHGSYAAAFILALSNGKRIRVVSRNVQRKTKKMILQRVRKPRDRTFLYVTVNSTENVLVSHDFEDFTQDKREGLRRDLLIHIVTAQEALPRFQAFPE
jgi:predicted nucleic acid-binding protein